MVVFTFETDFQYYVMCTERESFLAVKQLVAAARGKQHMQVHAIACPWRCLFCRLIFSM
jgi:hypothetical protein